MPSITPPTTTPQPIDFTTARVLVLGAGREGTAAAAFLATTYPNARITVADQQPVVWSMPHIPLRTTEDYPTSLREWDVVVVSPGIPPHTPLLASAQRITTGTNIFFQHCQGTIIGITGSKGKSTTASLIAHILSHAGKRAHLVGNIGNPALTELQKTNTAADLWVYELSSYQTRLLEHGPDIAIITSLFPEHLDYHGSVEQYYTDKLRVTTTQSPHNLLIYNHDCEELYKRIKHTKAKTFPWPSNSGAHVQNNVIHYGIETILPTTELSLKGQHNISNVLGAVTVLKHLAIDTTRIAEGLRTFTPLPHRLQNIGTYHTITFINDAISTTPESTLAALNTITPVGCLILGGQDRGYNFTKLTQRIGELNIPCVILFPNSGTNIYAALKKQHYTGAVHRSTTMEDAIRWVYQHTPQHTHCLLSCASPSYSIFKNFKDRGNQFTHWVRTLSDNNKGNSGETSLQYNT